MVSACSLDPASSFIMFGVLQIMTGLVYGVPMPVQPLKAMAVLMISQKLSGNLLYGAGLSIGIIMLILTTTNLLKLVVKYIPKSVVRGIQFGLGLSLAKLALGEYVMKDGLDGYLLAGVGFLITIILIGNKKYPPAIFVILVGIVFASFASVDFSKLFSGYGLQLPKIHVPVAKDIIDGFLLLAIPQIALSISNSIIATKRTVSDLFPEKNITVNKIGWTYSVMNLVNPFFSGIPTCHGAGGMAGHYSFGGRTGGSVVLYGTLFLIIGLFFSSGFSEFVKFFPNAILGIILLFEALSLMTFVMDIAVSKKCLYVAFVVALIAFLLPYGYAIGLVTGIILDAMIKKDNALRHL